VGTAEQITLQDVRDQLEVNYLGPVALTQAVLPAMREAGRGRILTVTSVGGAVGQPFADAYCGAKFAVEGFMQSLAVVLLDAYLARTRGAFAAAQSAHEAGAAIAAAATSPDYRFRWQTSSQATSFVGLSLADIDGERVSGVTRTWIA
jgi:hypothetical protein